MRNLALFIPLISFIFMGCDYTKYKEEQEANKKFDLSREQKSQLSFNFVYQKIFAPNCVSCHGSSGNVNLETYPNVLAQISKIKASIFENRTMPKRGALTNREQAILWNWIEMGAPAQPQGGPPETPPEPIKPTFESIDKNIFKITCVKCHSPENPGKRVLLTKSELLNSPRELVLPGNADESGLVLVLERKDEKRMPPAKEGYSQLKDEQIKAIRDWISQGAVN